MGILIKEVSKRFPPGRGEKQGHLAADHVTFAVPQGQLVALLGPSGSGKSTILRIIAGLEIPDTGEVLLDGQVVTGHPVHQRGVGFVFQHYALFKHATVEKNIAFGLEVRKWPRQKIRARVSELLDLVQLGGYEDRYPSQLSGGQRQRVALARALAPRPRVLLLDEPFGALDAKVRRNLATQLRELHSEFSTTTVFVTHDQEEAIEISDEIVVINKGRVEQMGSAEEIYDRPNSKFVASFIGNVNVVEGDVQQGILRLGPPRYAVPEMGVSLPDGEVVLLVRPEDVELLVAESAQGLEGVIRDVRYRGDRYEQDVEVAGMLLRAIEFKNRGRAAHRQPGQNVHVRFTRHRMFEVEEDHAAIRAQLQSLGYIE